MLQEELISLYFLGKLSSKQKEEFDRLMVAEGAKLYCTCNLKSKTSTAPVPPTMKKPADAVLVDKEPSISSLG